jgi:hypothetical protein
MSAEDNLSTPQFKWVPNKTVGYQIKNHILSDHFQQRQLGDPQPSKYDDEAWVKIHDQLHAEGKVSKEHKHWTPKKK